MQNGHEETSWNVEPAEGNVGERRSLPVGSWLVEVQHHPRHGEIVATAFDASREIFDVYTSDDAPGEMDRLASEFADRIGQAWDEVGSLDLASRVESTGAAASAAEAWSVIRDMVDAERRCRPTPWDELTRTTAVRVLAEDLDIPRGEVLGFVQQTIERMEREEVGLKG